jgi:lipopolysaccharide/colanic/teichoic acid biosynthesis glycosyltransferase
VSPEPPVRPGPPGRPDAGAVRPNAYLGSRRKRALDLLGASVALLLAAPLLAVAVLAIRLEGPGHPIYRQRRVGRDGAPFDLFKLRTMVSGAETMGSGLIVDQGDVRITRVGSLLRRTSLDELPNLINVLRGDMSLVGPRPTVQVQVDRYSERQRHRLDTRPGITGWAQVNGRASLPWSERIELDLTYLDRASLGLDLRILALSVRMVVTGHGLYRGETGGWR